MRVAIDEAGEHGHFRKVDYRGAGGNRDIFADGFDFAVADHDQLIRKSAAGVDVDEFAGADYRDIGVRLLGAGADGSAREEQKSTNELFEHDESYPGRGWYSI